MPEVPKPFVGSDKAFDAASPIAVGVGRAPGQHDFKGIQQMFGNLQVGCIASMMERDQYLIRQPSRMPWQAGWRGISRNVFCGD